LVQIFRHTAAYAIAVRLLIPEVLDAEVSVAGRVDLDVGEVNERSSRHIVRVSGLPPRVRPDRTVIGFSDRQSRVIMLVLNFVKRAADVQNGRGIERIDSVTRNVPTISL